MNPIGQMQIQNIKTGKEKMTRNAQVAHFCYLRFVPSLQEGKEYVIENPLGESIKFQGTFKNRAFLKIIKKADRILNVRGDIFYKASIF